MVQQYYSPKNNVIFGVLTTDNTEQALARIEMAVGYAESAVEMGSKIFDP